MGGDCCRLHSPLTISRIGCILTPIRRWEVTVAVTASILYNLVHCPQRVALDTFGDSAARDPVNAFVRLLWERGTLYERETIGKLNQPFLDLSEVADAERERLTIEAMRRGEPLIYSG